MKVVRRFEVVHGFADMQSPIILEADEAVETLWGTLKFFSGGHCIATFKARSWGAWWMQSARVVQDEPGRKEKADPIPYIGPLTPEDRPGGWHR